MKLYDDEGDLIYSYGVNEIKHVQKGIYCAEISLSGVSDCGMLNDVWDDIYLNGDKLSCVSMDIVIRDDNQYFNIGGGDVEPENLNVSLYGIKKYEKIKRGDVRKVLC